MISRIGCSKTPETLLEGESRLNLATLQDKHSQLQTLSLQQHQEKLLSIEAETYTEFVQSGLLKAELPSTMQKVFHS